MVVASSTAVNARSYYLISISKVQAVKKKQQITAAR